MAWNCPRARKMKARQVSGVFLVKEEFTKRDTKRLKLHKPLFKPRPICNRLSVVEEVDRLVGKPHTAHEEALACP